MRDCVVRIQKLHEDAMLPEYAHPGDAGMDVFAVEDLMIPAHGRAVVQTGVAMAVPEGFVALVWDKSGRALKDGLTTLAGVIDSGYRGEVGIVLYNTTDTGIVVKKGEKVAQILIQPIVSAQLQEVSSLDETARGEGGFGSTGLS